MEDGGFGYYGMGFEAFGAEEEQEAEVHLSAWEWEGDPMELEISKEEVHAPTELTPSSMILSSTSTRKNKSPSTNDSPVNQSDEGPSSHDAPASSVSNDTNPADEWLCDFTNCGKSFTHRHKLNRHTKYHIKPHQCREPSCAAQRIGFSLKKDLVRHQAKHNGRRFYCHHAGCLYAIGGTEGGFTRKDNLKRHITKRH